MKDKGTLEINQQDHDLLIAGLRKLPLSGNLDTLPKGMEVILDLIYRIEGALMEEGNGVSNSSGETSKQ